ncbi:MAG: TrkA family potassium uptake protein [Halodesulfurarchaeum sp.]
MTQDLRVIIAGGGAVGLRTAELLDDRGNDVVIVEPDPDRAARLSEEYVGTVIEGDAARPSILRQTQPERADVLAALTDDEATNFAACMAAQRMTDVRTVMRVGQEPDDLYREYVDDIVFPERLGSRVAANLVTGPGVRTIEEVAGDVEILEIEVEEGAPAAGKELTDVRLPIGSLIVVDAGGNRIGGPETVLEAGASYIVAVETSVVDEVLNLLRG